MALLQIKEPLRPRKRLSKAVGIDLGTTHSLVAMCTQDQVKILEPLPGTALLPSVVRFLDNKQVVVGDEAKKAAFIDPLNTIFSVKRLMGRTIQAASVQGVVFPYNFSRKKEVHIKTRAGLVSPIEISAHILKALYQVALKTTDPLEGAVITVPAYFDEGQRQATKAAAKCAGIKVLRLLNEPTSAAIAYGLDQQSEGLSLVYDLGGGTFDVSVLRHQEGVFQVIATGGGDALRGR